MFFSQTVSAVSVAATGLERLVEVVVDDDELKGNVVESRALKLAVVLILAMRTDVAFEAEVDLVFVVDGGEMLEIERAHSQHIQQFFLPDVHDERVVEGFNVVADGAATFHECLGEEGGLILPRTRIYNNFLHDHAVH